MNQETDKLLRTLLLCLAMWLPILFFMSRTGWHQFGKKYRTSIRPAGESFNCPTAMFGDFTSYRNVMRVIFEKSGVYIYPFFLFRLFHPPFLVPWAKIVGPIKKKGFFITRTQLEIRDQVGVIHIALSSKALKKYERLEKHGA